MAPPDRLKRRILREAVRDNVDTIHGLPPRALRAGVRLVWLVDPHYRTVLVYRPDQEPELFNVRQELTAEPHLPGFRVPVAQIFGC